MIKAIFLDYTGTILREDCWQMKEVQRRVCAASTCRDEDQLLAQFHAHLKDWEAQSVGSTYRDADEVVTRALRDMKKGKDVSVCGFSVRMQVLATKLLPHKLVMKIWCKQQKK